MMQIVRFVKVPGRMSTVKPVNVAIASIVLLAIIIGILSIPLPHYVHCHLYVQPQKSHRVYVDVPGILTNINVEPNSFVETDDVILQVKNDNLLFAIADLESQVEDARIQYKNAVYLAQHEPKKAKEINPARVAYESLRDQLEQKKLELKKLTISAPAGGIVLQPPRVPPAPKDSGEPDVWHGTPLEKRNKGAFLPEGTLVCEIVEAGGKSEAILAIDQTDIEFIRSGQAVEYLIKQHPQQTFHSNIEKISPVEMKNVPRALASRFGGGLVTSQSEQGKEKPVSTTYRVSVPIETDVEVLPGATGVAKIRAGNRTIGQRLLRVACETFRFHL
jgi:putative peptide zinc metalloprotease protein